MSPTTSQPVIVNRLDGSTITFPKLTPSDRIAFRTAFRNWRKGDLYENLARAGITGAEMLKQLNDFDARQLGETSAVRWLNMAEGQWVALRMAVSKLLPRDGATDEVYGNRIDEHLNGLELDDDEMFIAAAGVMNVPIVRGDDKPDPPEGAAVTGSDGGTPTPSGSPDTSTSPPTP